MMGAQVDTCSSKLNSSHLVPGILPDTTREFLDWSPPLDHPDEYDDDRQDQQNVDKATQRV
jgi:hypothetical protein